MEIWWLLGAAIILALAAVAIHLHWRLYRLRQAQARQSEQVALGRQQQYQSIEIICRALLAEQVQPAEAGVRVAGLLNQLQVEGANRRAFIHFDEMDRAVAHIPRLKGWTDLDSGARRRYQKEIDQAEDRLGEAMRRSAETVLSAGVAASISAASQPTGS